MPFSFYAETSFTEICGRRYFNVRVRSCPTTGVHGRPRMVGIQCHQQQCHQCTLFCHGLKNFSAKGMSDFRSYTDQAYRTVS